MRSAKLSMSFCDGHVMVRVSAAPATRNCSTALGCASQSDKEVCIASILLKSAILIGWKIKKKEIIDDQGFQIWMK